MTTPSGISEARASGVIEDFVPLLLITTSTPAAVSQHRGGFLREHDMTPLHAFVEGLGVASSVHEKGRATPGPSKEAWRGEEGALFFFFQNPARPAQ